MDADVVITGLEVRAYTVPTDLPEADGTFNWGSTTMVLVQVTAGDAAAPATGLGYTYAPVACAHLVGDLLAPLVIGSRALDVSRTWETMRAAVRNAGYPGVAAEGVSAVDTALWDLKAVLLGVPLHRLLGAVRDRVPVYGSGGFTSYTDEQLHEQLAGWLDAGVRWVKIKIAESWGAEVDRDLARVRSAQEALDGRAELFVDANGGYSVGQAVRVGRALEELDVRWFEEPVSSDDLPGLAQVRSRVDMDVAAGEYGYDAGYFRRMCATGAVDCVQVDVTRCGGVTGWFRAAAVAQSHGLETSLHCAPALSVATALATPGLRHMEWFHDHVRVESLLLTGTPNLRDGAVEPSAGRGAGLAVDEERADGYRVL